MINPKTYRRVTYKLNRLFYVFVHVYKKYIFTYVTNKKESMNLKKNMKGCMEGFGGKTGNEKVT